jgi:hypothetical protein
MRDTLLSSFAIVAVTVAFSTGSLSAGATAQQRGGRGAPPPSPRQAAPIDLTGYWVSVVSEDWRFRMVTPPKGNYQSVPLNAEGRRVADMWDPAAKDEASGSQCKAYGAPAIMRVPGRVHITWQDDNTLKIDTDAGQQTRLFHFDGGPPPAGERQWQGYSVASWDMLAGAAAARKSGSLKVATTHIRPGYLRKNGVPYSENVVLTEYYDRHANFGEEWLTVTTIVSDPKYLNREFITTTDFKKEPNQAKWNPTPCEAP